MMMKIGNWFSLYSKMGLLCGQIFGEIALLISLKVVFTKFFVACIALFVFILSI